MKTTNVINTEQRNTSVYLAIIDSLYDERQWLKEFGKDCPAELQKTLIERITSLRHMRKEWVL